MNIRAALRADGRRGFPLFIAKVRRVWQTIAGTKGEMIYDPFPAMAGAPPIVGFEEMASGPAPASGRSASRNALFQSSRAADGQGLVSIGLNPGLDLLDRGVDLLSCRCPVTVEVAVTPTQGGLGGIERPKRPVHFRMRLGAARSAREVLTTTALRIRAGSLAPVPTRAVRV